MPVPVSSDINLISGQLNRMKKLFSIIGLATFATNANAEISYDYIDVGYKKASIDTLQLIDDNNQLIFGDIDGDGPAFEGSFSFAQNYFAFAHFDFARIELDSDLSFDLNTQLLGVGYHTDGDRQLVAKVGLLRREIDSNFWKEATLGYSAQLGGRGLLTDKFEWEANLEYSDFDANEGDGGDLGINAALRFHFDDNFSTDFSTSTDDDEVALGLNFRFNFSR